ncbi:MAG TPA: hypothetical protein VG796_22105 [Verrucomicrobiales bacterium]|jgi:hypothetical protein|nr:hypothetical protein [Verrucomicrobiales bacterium]
MICRAFTVLAFCLVAAPLAAQDKPASGSARKIEPKDKDKDKAEASLPADTRSFYGEVTGTVASVDTTKSELSVKVASTKADSARNKAPKPEALAGQMITITPLLKKGADGKEALDAASVSYIKGAKTGDSITVSVRASSKGVVFRLLKVPTSVGQ